MSTTPSSVKVRVSSEKTNTGIHLEATAYRESGVPVGDFDAFASDDPYSLRANELYVPPTERRKGIGEALVRELSQAAKEEKFIQLESRILTSEALRVRRKVFGETALHFFHEAPGAKEPIEIPITYQQALESLDRAQSKKFSKSLVDKSIGVDVSLETMLPSAAERTHAFTEVSEDDPTLNYEPFEELRNNFNIPIQNTDNMYAYFVEHDEESLLHTIYDASSPETHERVPATINLMKLKRDSPDAYGNATNAAIRFEEAKKIYAEEKSDDTLLAKNTAYLEMHYQMTLVYDALLHYPGETEESVMKLLS